MKPLTVIKQINKTIDEIMREIEDCKKAENKALYELYMAALFRAKYALQESIEFVSMTIPK